LFLFPAASTLLSFERPTFMPAIDAFRFVMQEASGRSDARGRPANPRTSVGNVDGTNGDNANWNGGKVPWDIRREEFPMSGTIIILPEEPQLRPK
jgi:hypothetical protein